MTVKKCANKRDARTEDIVVLPIERLRFTFTSNGKRDQVFPILSFAIYYFCSKISSFTPVLSIRIVLDSFYLLIFYFDKLSTWIRRWQFAVNVTLNLSNSLFYRSRWRRRRRHRSFLIWKRTDTRATDKGASDSPAQQNDTICWWRPAVGGRNSAIRINQCMQNIMLQNWIWLRSSQ